jgi:nucleotide-binding universal stress UspA family protein
MAGEIVVGYDGSAGARAGLDAAVDMAKKLSTGLIIVYGYEVSKFGGEVADLAAALRDLGEALTVEAAEIARAAGLDPQTDVVDGHPAQALADAAADAGAQMIVVSNRGEGQLRGIIVGSLAPKLLQVASVPVLVVPAD